MMAVLEKTVLPTYYSDQPQWLNIVKQAATDIVPAFEASRLADQYYQHMYN
ncbi:hypothetical protein [Mucilaginibacter gilvus]|uniref:hypothetical protein n=1 Tax=Mucilaginibacter gilvus TaxID=2305909 RepID=UPI0014192DB5|nr:hypothetical protein [Mucilaginibacter gilvus]